MCAADAGAGRLGSTSWFVIWVDLVIAPSFAGYAPGLTYWISVAIKHGVQNHDGSEAVPQVKLHGVPFFGKKSEISPDGQLTEYRTLDLLGARCPVGSMMFVIFRILLVDFELILRDIHKLCSQEHITDPSYFSDGSERHSEEEYTLAEQRAS